MSDVKLTNIPLMNVGKMVDMGKISNSIAYATKLPPDFSVVVMKDYMYIEDGYKEKLIAIPEFSRWLGTKGSLLNGVK